MKPTPQIPVFVICRDRVSCLQLLVSWLESAGHERIYFVDNDSSYAPLLEYYESTPHTVIRLNENLGHRAPWKSGVVPEVARGPYVVTDPDVLPTEECPTDAVLALLDALGRHPGACKAGLGLVTDDLPEHFALRGYVRAWEEQHWKHQVEPGLYSAPIDTTFAVYRAGLPFAKKPALRTGPPYLARHLPWYADSANPTEEERYYESRVRAQSHTWSGERVPEKLEGFFHQSRWARVRRKIRRLRHVGRTFRVTKTHP